MAASEYSLWADKIKCVKIFDVCKVTILFTEEKTMTVYDCANELAREMRATREFAVLKEAKERLSAEPDTKALIARFMQLGQEVEIARYQKKEIPAEKEAQFNDMMRTLSLNPLALNYLNAFQRFQLMFQDVSKTITDVVKEVAE